MNYVIIEADDNFARDIAWADTWTNAFTTAYAWSLAFPNYTYIAATESTRLSRESRVARYKNGVFLGGN